MRKSVMFGVVRRLFTANWGCSNPYGLEWSVDYLRRIGSAVIREDWSGS